MSRASEQLRRELGEARSRLAATGIADPALAFCISGLARLEEALARPVSVVILGEYNSGKTSVADLLIGDGLLPTSVVANTQVPVLITYAETAALYGVDQDDTRIRIDSDDDDDPLTDLAYRALQIALPLERLKGYQILDTPSLVAPATFVGDADIVIWCTVATRAWTESERAAWQALPRRCARHALLVATHRDALQTEEEVAEVTARLSALTRGLFRDVVLVGAEGEGAAAASGGPLLREKVERLVQSIAERRAEKAGKIVRRLARLTFHQFARDEVRPEQAPLIARWELGAARLLDELGRGRRTAPQTIEELLAAYAVFAERLRPGVVTGDSISAAPASRALAAPVRWPSQGSAAARLVAMLVSDLTGLLRMLSGSSIFVDPALRAEYQAARGVLLSLADLDSAFVALGRMLGRAAGEGGFQSRSR